MTKIKNPQDYKQFTESMSAVSKLHFDMDIAIPRCTDAIEN